MNSPTPRAGSVCYRVINTGPSESGESEGARSGGEDDEGDKSEAKNPSGATCGHFRLPHEPSMATRLGPK